MRPEKQTTPIEPLFHRAFPFIFGKAESKTITRSLVNAVLAHTDLEPIGEIEHIDAEHTALGGSVNCKMPRMDIRIIAADRLVDLEAQRYPEDVANRSIAYGAQLLTESITADMNYKDLPQVIIITLLDTAPLLPGDDDFVHTSHMLWDVNDGFVDASDRIVFVLVELEKIRRSYNRLTDEVLADELLSWAYLLTVGYDNAEEVAMIAEKIPSVEEFAELYGLAIDDPKVKRAFEDAVSAEREYKSRQDYLARIEQEAAEKAEKTGRERGERIGFEKGEAIGLERGEAIGLEKGEAIGVEKSLVSSIANLMETLQLTAQQAMDALKIPVEDREKYRDKL